MTKRKVKTIIQSLEKVNQAEEPVPEAVLEDARRRLIEYDGLYQKDPFVDIKELEAWAAAAIHASMMDKFTKNKLPARELADRLDVQKHLVSNRSRRLRKTLKAEKSSRSDRDGQFDELLENEPSDSATEKVMAELLGKTPGGRAPSLNTEPLRFVTKNIETQLTVDGIGDFEALCDNFDWTEKQRREVLDLFDEGFADYFDYVYEDNFSINPLSVDDRIADPAAVGFGWLSLVRSDISDSIKCDVARYLLALALEVKNDPEFSLPAGILIAVGKLAEADILGGEQLETALQLALSEHYVAQNMNRDDFEIIVQVIVRNDDFSVEKSATLLGKLMDRISSQSNPHLPQKVFKDILETLSNEALRGNFLRFILAPEESPGLIHVSRSVKKLAGEKIIKHSGNPGETVEWLLERAGSRRHNNDTWAALAESLKHAGDTVEDELLRKCYNQARCRANARSRKPFYQLAYRRFGKEIIEDAKNDNANSIRRWARKTRKIS